MDSKITDLDAGAPVSAVFLLQNKVLAQARSGKSYLTLTLADKNGRYEGKLWDQAELVDAQLEKLTPVEVEGVVSVYRDKHQITVRTIRSVPWNEGLYERLVPVSDFSRRELVGHLDRLLESITDRHLAALVRSLRSDERFMHRFLNAPAAKIIHHAYIRGLLEHTVSMMRLADHLADHYGAQFPGLLNRDLLLVGTLFHDLGKTEEYEFERGIDITTRGRLIGHLVIGLEILNRHVATLPDFPTDLADRLRHLIVSHHGDFEKGAPLRPVTLEAQLLHLIDYLDSQVNAVGTLMKGASDGDWTDYSTKFGRRFLLTREEQEKTEAESPEREEEGADESADPVEQAEPAAGTGRVLDSEPQGFDEPSDRDLAADRADPVEQAEPAAGTGKVLDSEPQGFDEPSDRDLAADRAEHVEQAEPAAGTGKVLDSEPQGFDEPSDRDLAADRAEHVEKSPNKPDVPEARGEKRAEHVEKSPNKPDVPEARSEKRAEHVEKNPNKPDVPEAQNKNLEIADRVVKEELTVAYEMAGEQTTEQPAPTAVEESEKERPKKPKKSSPKGPSLF